MVWFGRGVYCADAQVNVYIISLIYGLVCVWCLLCWCVGKCVRGTVGRMGFVVSAI